METIIYTNNKREAANYQVDKICFADRVDISQLVEDQMNHYNIRHLNLWFITNNLKHIPGNSEQKLLISTGKYLSENKDMTFVFEYLVEKYHPVENNSKNNEPETPALLKRQSNISSIREQSICSYSDKGRESEDSCKSSKTGKQSLMRQQLVREEIKFANFREFEVFLQKEQQNTAEPDTIKTYIFKTTNEILKISFIEHNKKKILKQIIDHDYDRVYDAKLHLTKKLTLGTHLSHKFQQPLPIVPTFYNKLILFLFQNDKNQENITRKRVLVKTSTPKPDLSQEALEQWRIKEEALNIVAKLEKECELVKQQIQSERLLFRNKIKAIENELGQSINLQKLVQEEDEDQANKLQTNTSNFNFKKNKKSSFSQTQPSPAPKNNNSNPSTSTSQFKRLKDISDAMRNIDNTLAEQNKKIQIHKKRLKQLVKNRESLLYSNACELNKIKQQILEAKSQIQRKELQIKQKTKNGTFQQMLALKNKHPTPDALTKLEQHKQFINNFKNTQAIESSASIKPTATPSEPQKPKKQSEYRIVHKSQHNQRTQSNAENFDPLLKFRQKKIKEVEESLQQEQYRKQNQQTLLKKTIKKPFSVSLYPNCNSQTENISKTEAVNTHLMEQLTELYRHYRHNHAVIEKMKKQIQDYQLVQQQPMNVTIKKSTNSSKSKQKWTGNQSFTINEFNEVPILDLTDFPLLSEYLKSINTSQQNHSKTTVQTIHKQSFKEQIRYPQGYFDLMIGNYNTKSPQAHQSSLSTIKSVAIDKLQEDPVLTNRSVSKKKLACSQLLKHKRTTIQEAIKLQSSLLKYNKVHK